MKPETIIQLVLTSLGAAIAGAGYFSEAETATFVGSGVAFITLAWTAFSRWRASRVPIVILAALFSPIYFTGCSNLTPAQREGISNALIEVAKVGLKFGLNALAQRYPEIAPFVPKLEAQFRVTFSNADAIATPDAFAAEVRRIVTEVVTDAETAHLIISILSNSIKQEASANLAVASPPNESLVTPVIFALQVTENLK